MTQSQPVRSSSKDPQALKRTIMAPQPMKARLPQSAGVASVQPLRDTHRQPQAASVQPPVVQATSVLSQASSTPLPQEASFSLSLFDNSDLEDWDFDEPVTKGMCVTYGYEYAMFNNE